MYEDLVIRISGPDRGDGYRVWIETQSGGEDVGTLRLPWSRDEIGDALQQFSFHQQGMRDTSGDAGSTPPARAQPIELGTRLFESLFADRLLRLYGGIRQQVRASNSLLRILLKLDSLPELHSVPWESLYDPVDGQFLVLNRWSTVVRYLDVSQPVRSTVIVSPLQVLVVTANPAGTQPLRLARESQSILDAFRDIRGIRVELLENASPRTLQQELMDKKPDVVHFMGHGGIDRDTREGVIRLQDGDGRVASLSGPMLNLLFDNCRSVQFVFLNACETAQTGGDPMSFQPFSGVATSLVQGGIPAVLAMQFPISDQAANVFCQAFYERLAKGDPIEAAVAWGRQAVRLQDQKTTEWMTPVLFLRTQVSAKRTDPVPAGPAESVPVRERQSREALLERYLRHLVERFRFLDLPGLPQGGRRQSVPLEAVYTVLRGDRATPFERAQSQAALVEQARRLEDLPSLDALTPEERSRMVWRQVSLVARDPFPVSIEERDRPHLFQQSGMSSLNLAAAFRQERRLVILGDPGSGKTTLVRWLALRLAQALLLKQDRVWVPARQIDPATGVEDGILDLGPARIPIFLRVATFAAAWQADPSIKLEVVLGSHLGLSTESGEQIDPADLQALLLELLDAGRTVVLLDGLDEISDPADRHEIVRAIDGFLDRWLPDDAQWTPGPPFEAGGNQAIITSRIVGYQMAPLSQAAAHLTIEPMSRPAVTRFCDLWIQAVHRATRQGRWDDEAQAEAARESRGLQNAIADLEQRGAGELASTPLLITILALVFRQGESSLPRQRVKLYDMTVSILIQQWRARARIRGTTPFSEEEVRALLVPLAQEVHRRSGIGVIDETELKAWLRRQLDAAGVAAFLGVVREEIGLLTARGEGVYGFLHLTFQEYLAGCALARETREAPDRLLQILSAPRWREPVLMALGQLSSELEQTALESLLLAMLSQADPLGDLVPRAALLLVAAIPEMTKVPPRAVEEAAAQLLATYARRDDLQRLPSLAEQLERAFVQLTAGEHAGAADRVLLRALQTRDDKSPERRLAAAALARVTGRVKASLAEALASSLEHDSVLWGWPVDRALRAVAAQAPDLLPDPANSLRHALVTEPEWRRSFLSYYDWLRLGIALYGGVDEPYLARVAEARTACERLQRELRYQPGKTSAPAHAGTVERLQRELVTAQETLAREQESGFWFAPARMHRESPGVTPLVVDALHRGEQPLSLVPALWELWRTSAERTERRDALLALIALGQPVDPALDARGALPTDVAAHLSRIAQSLRSVIRHTLLPTLGALGKLAAECPWQSWTDLVAAVLDVGITLGQQPTDLIDLEAAAPEAAQPYLVAEAWSYQFSVETDDARFQAAVLLDNFGTAISTPPLKLAKALAVAPMTVNGRWGQGPGWALERLVPLPEQTHGLITAALDAIVAMPLDFVQHWALQQLGSLFDTPGLRLEAMILAVGLPGDDSLRRDTLTALDVTDEDLRLLLVDPYPALTLLRAVQSLTDAYSRFRCMWRLLQFFSDLRPHLMSGASAAPAAAEAIVEPTRRAWAFEQLSDFGDPEQRNRFLGAAYDATHRIQRTSNRARSLARLASRLPLEDGDQKLLAEALTEAARIPDLRERAETLFALRPSLLAYPDLAARLTAIVAGFGDDGWNRAKAQGLSAYPLLVYGPALAQAGGDLGALLLGALVNDMRRLLALPSDLSSLWAALSSPNRQSALKALTQRARVDGLRLTYEAAAAVHQLLDTSGPSAIQSLLPLLQHPQASTVAILESWREHPDPALRLQANLLLAETEGISQRTLPGLIDLLTSPADRARYRASLVLTGDGSEICRPATTTNLGTGTMALLAGELLQRLETQPQVAQILGWTLDRIEHNDGRAITHWAATAMSQTPFAEASLVLLRRIRYLRTTAWTAFREQLASGPPPVQRALLHSLCLMLTARSISEERWNEIVPSLRSLSAATLDQDRFVLDPQDALVEAAAVTLSTAGGGEDPAGIAEQAYASRLVPLGAVLQQDPSSLRTMLASVGDLYIASKLFYERVAAAARRIEREPQTLDVLVDWLITRLRQDVRDRDQISWLSSNLLSVIAAAAERLPSAFANKAGKVPHLDRLLRETVEHHNTFTGRQAALSLLSYTRCVTRHTMAALRAGLRDTARVQKVALEGVFRYRRIEPDLLPQLYDDLEDPSPAVAYATVELLAAIARNVHLPAEVRRDIVAALAALIDKDQARRDVYLLTCEGDLWQGIYHIRHQGRLDQIVYRVVAQLTGIADLGATAAAPAAISS